MKTKILVALTFVIALAVTGATAQSGGGPRHRIENGYNDRQRFDDRDNRFNDDAPRFHYRKGHQLTRREKRMLMRERKMQARRHFMYRHHRSHRF